MSTSFSSFESLVYIMNTQYDPSLPAYYVPQHIEIVKNVIHIMMRHQEMEVVVTNITLQEPIIANRNIIYISVPLVAMLVNLNISLPKEHVKITTNFNIFQNIRPRIRAQNSNRDCVINYQRGIYGNNTNADSSEYNTTPRGPQFTSIEITRIVQLLRIVQMCAHFYQHYTLKHSPPYLRHDDFEPLELAHLTKEKLRKKIKSRYGHSSSSTYNHESMNDVLQRTKLDSAVGSSFATSLISKAVDVNANNGYSETHKRRKKS